MTKQFTLDIGIKPKEKDILKAVKDYLKLNGFFVIRNHQGLGVHRGLSDLTAIKDGRALWIETKVPGGRLSQYQVQFQRDIQNHGGTYLIVTDIDDLIRYLEHKEELR